MEKGEVSPLSGYITIPRKSLSREEVFAVADRLPGGIAPPRNSAFRIPNSALQFDSLPPAPITVYLYAEWQSFGRRLRRRSPWG